MTDWHGVAGWAPRHAVHIVVVTPVGLVRNSHSDDVQNVVTLAELFR